MHRFAKGKEYYVLPGGGVESGENVREAVVREVREETSLGALEIELLAEIVDSYDGRTHHLYLIKKWEGKEELGGPEAKRNSEENKYILEWHDVASLGSLQLFPESVKGELVEYFSNEKKGPR